MIDQLGILRHGEGCGLEIVEQILESVGCGLKRFDGRDVLEQSPEDARPGRASKLQDLISAGIRPRKIRGIEASEEVIRGRANCLNRIDQGFANFCPDAIRPSLDRDVDGCLIGFELRTKRFILEIGHRAEARTSILGCVNRIFGNVGFGLQLVDFGRIGHARMPVVV